MAIFFSGKELLQIAVGIEHRGFVFYERLKDSAREPRVKAAWDYLAGQEKGHIQVFQELLDSLEGESLPVNYEEEFGFYLKALVRTTVFTDDKTVMEMANKVTSDAEAIQIALGFEKDSILFFSEMRPLVRERERPVVDKVLEEERAHLRQLTELKEELTKQL
jgi:rubrerythrin